MYSYYFLPRVRISTRRYRGQLQRLIRGLKSICKTKTTQNWSCTCTRHEHCFEKIHLKHAKFTHEIVHFSQPHKIDATLSAKAQQNSWCFLKKNPMSKPQIAVIWPMRDQASNPSPRLNPSPTHGCTVVKFSAVFVKHRLLKMLQSQNYWRKIHEAYQGVCWLNSFSRWQQKIPKLQKVWCEIQSFWQTQIHLLS